MTESRSWTPVPPGGGVGVHDLVVIALGGNAMTAEDGRATPEDQIKALTRAAEYEIPFNQPGTLLPARK